MKRPADKPRIPSHLRPETRRWFEHVTDEFALEQHHVRLLTLAGEAWDRCTQAREAIENSGLTVEDRFGFPRPPAGDRSRAGLAFGILSHNSRA